MLYLDRWVLNALIDGRIKKSEVKKFKRFEGTTASDLQEAIESKENFIANDDDFSPAQKDVFFEYLVKLQTELEAS